MLSQCRLSLAKQSLIPIVGIWINWPETCTLQCCCPHTAGLTRGLVPPEAEGGPGGAPSLKVALQRSSLHLQPSHAALPLSIRLAAASEVCAS